MATQTGGGTGGAQPSLWEEDKPCYCKTGNAAVLALCLQEKSSLSSSMPLKERMHWLHRVHMKLDAVVVAHKANKFSGSSDSYLVVLPCDSELEAEEKTTFLGEKLLDAAQNDAVIRAVGGFGEVGFGVLGSTGWNYQFYGDLITSMQHEAKECIPGVYHYRKPTHTSGKHFPSPSGKSMEGCSQGRNEMDEVILPSYAEWRARNLQHSELWVLMITLLLSILAILGAVEKTQNNKEVHVLSFVLQLQCFFVNLVAIGIWFVNQKFFMAHHQQVMMCVWICQFLNRFIGMVAMPIEPKGLFQLYPTFRVIAANGPEKLLLTSVPMVNTACSLFLHLCGTLSAVFFSLCSCSEYRSGALADSIDVPYECRDDGRFYMVLLNLLVSLGIPVSYAAYSDFKAQKEYLAFKNPKSKKQL